MGTRQSLSSLSVSISSPNRQRQVSNPQGIAGPRMLGTPTTVRSGYVNGLRQNGPFLCSDEVLVDLVPVHLQRPHHAAIAPPPKLFNSSTSKNRISRLQEKSRILFFPHHTCGMLRLCPSPLSVYASTQAQQSIFHFFTNTAVMNACVAAPPMPSN